MSCQRALELYVDGGWAVDALLGGGKRDRTRTWTSLSLTDISPSSVNFLLKRASQRFLATTAEAATLC
jgi:hypothetical protein